MKRSKIIVLLSMLLVAATMLCACGASELSFKKIADGSKYESTPVYTNYQQISSLQNANLQNSSYDGSLLTFTDNTGDYTKHIVYSLKNAAAIFTVTEAETTDISITTERAYESDGEFFLVRTTTYQKKNGIVDYSDYETVTTLYDANGVQKHSVRYSASYEVSYDLLSFGGKVFRINENGISNELPISPLAEIPDIFYATNEYYYAENDEMILFYTKELKLVSSYKVPGYANTSAAVLLPEDNKILIQYAVEADSFGDDYDILAEGEKYDLYTVLIDAEDGDAKEIDLEYVIRYGEVLTDEDRAYYGFNEEVANICTVYPIVDKHLDDSIAMIATISKKGDISFFEKINGLPVEDIELVGKNIWHAETVAGPEYFLNEKGEVIGEVSGADSMNEAYILAGGKIYDYGFNQVYDYEAAGYTVERRFSKSIVFEDRSGDLILYQNGSTQTITNRNNNRTFYTTLGSNCYVIRDASNPDNIRYEIYNENGSRLLDLNSDYNFSLDYVAENEYGLLIKVTGYDTNTYRTTYTYYNIK